MHGYIKDERTSHLVFIGIWLLYTVICLSKNSYAASIASIVSDGLFTKSDAGTINAAFYLVYGIAQLALSRLTDKFRPWRMLYFGAGAALLCTLIMALSRSFISMLIGWSLNGLLQFAVWPATLKVVTTVLKPTHRRKAAIYISICLATGSFISYLSAMVLLKYFSWPSLFWLSAILLLAVLIFWIVITLKAEKNLCYDAPVAPKEEKKEEGAKVPLLRLMFVSGFMFILFNAVGRCMLDNGVKTWVPTMMMESYGISASTSSFIATLVTVINVAGAYLASFVQRKANNSAMTASAILFGGTVPLFCLLLLTGKLPIIFVSVLLISTTTATYAINQLIMVEVPAAFEKYNCIGTVSSILNAFASFGVMLAAFGYGFLAEHFGWSAVLITWVVISTLSTVCCVSILRRWNRFTKN